MDFPVCLSGFFFGGGGGGGLHVCLWVYVNWTPDRANTVVCEKNGDNCTCSAKQRRYMYILVCDNMSHKESSVK